MIFIMKILTVSFTLFAILTISQAGPINSTTSLDGGLCAHKEHYCSNLIGSFCPKCDANGNFLPQQCSGSTGYCWCVNVITGKEIPNTKTPPGVIPVNCMKKDCPDGWFQFGHQCFSFIKSPKTWIEAQIYCQFDGGNLASIHSYEENRFVQTLTRGNTHDFPETWIGGTDAIHPDVWMWIDGSKFNYENWYSSNDHDDDSRDHNSSSHHDSHDDSEDHDNSSHHDSHHNSEDHDSSSHHDSHDDSEDHDSSSHHDSHDDSEDHDNSSHHDSHHDSKDHDHDNSSHHDSHGDNDDHGHDNSSHHDSHHDSDDHDSSSYHDSHHDSKDHDHDNSSHHDSHDDSDDHDSSSHHDSHHDSKDHDHDNSSHHDSHDNTDDHDDHHDHHSHNKRTSSCLRMNCNYKMKWCTAACDDAFPFVCSRTI